MSIINVEEMSQKFIVLEHLKQRGTITPLEALGLYSIYRLAPVIQRLRKMGYNIHTEIKRSVRQRPYGEYRLISRG